MWWVNTAFQCYKSCGLSPPPILVFFETWYRAQLDDFVLQVGRSLAGVSRGGVHRALPLFWGVTHSLYLVPPVIRDTQCVDGHLTLPPPSIPAGIRP